MITDVYLRPEMYTYFRFLADQPTQGACSQRQGVFVPSTAIRDREGKKIVFIAFKGKALAREVRVVAPRSGGQLVEGLNGGEDVITSTAHGLTDGDQLKVKGQSLALLLSPPRRRQPKQFRHL